MITPSLSKFISHPELTEFLLQNIPGHGVVVCDNNFVVNFISTKAAEVISKIASEKQSDCVGKNLKDIFFNVLSLEGQAINFEALPFSRAVEDGDYIQGQPFFIKTNSFGNDVAAISAKPLVAGNIHYGAIIFIRIAKRQIELSEMKNLFLTFAAHQLKTPSSIVKGFLELVLLEAGSLPKETKRSIESAYQANEELIKIS